MKRTNHVFLVGSHAFVKHPTIRGAWLRTDSSVFLVTCTYCQAKKGSLCRGATESLRKQTAPAPRRWWSAAKLRRGGGRRQLVGARRQGGVPRLVKARAELASEHRPPRPPHPQGRFVE